MDAPVIVIGAGKVGRFIIEQLNDYPLIVADHNAHALESLPAHPAINTTVVEHPQHLSALLHQQKVGIAISCVPGNNGFLVAKTVLETGTPLIDVSFLPYDAIQQLARIAQHRNTWYIPDAGIAPGFSNLFLGWVAIHIDVETFSCYVGGLPQQMRAPLYYQAPFNATDALSEYLRPARLRFNGRDYAVDPLSEIHFVDEFNVEVGPLTAFYSDGLRTLLDSFPQIPTMREMTLRYPPHLPIIRTLVELQLLTESRLPLIAEWLAPLLIATDPDITLMLCRAESAAGDIVKLRLVDRANPHYRSMSKMTGTVAVEILRAVLHDPHRIQQPGMYPPEFFADHFLRVVEALRCQGATVALEVPFATNENVQH